MSNGTLAWRRFILANLVVGIAVAGTAWGRRIEGARFDNPDLLKNLKMPFRDWKTADMPIKPNELELLTPDTYVIRRYIPPKGDPMALRADPKIKDLQESDLFRTEVAVIAGHRKRTIHTPAFCMAAGGWEMVHRAAFSLDLGNGNTIPATQNIFAFKGNGLLVTFFFTDGEYHNPSLNRFQLEQMLKRFKSGVGIGALVRITVPIYGEQRDAEALTNEFARATIPTVLETLRAARLTL